jgi:predicted small secreted protein
MTARSRAILFIVLAAFGLSLSGCGTVRGVGEDMQGAGRAIKRAAG